MFGRPGILRAAAMITRRPNMQNQIRKSSHTVYYRTIAQANKEFPFQVECAHYVTAFAWWWVFLHFWTDPGHVFGEFPYPDATKWTDDELGIPEA